MATRVPLLILDEIMLPGTATEVALDPAEHRFLEERAGGPDAPLIVGVTCRRPGGTAPTSLEQRAEDSPGALTPAALIGEGTLIPPAPTDPTPRLVLERTTRAHLDEVRRSGEGWEGRITPWAYDREGFDPAEAEVLRTRFYRALLASRGDDTEGLREQVERPVQELEAAEDPLVRLLLVADYLFERPDVRFDLLVADGARSVRDAVADALDILEEGLPPGPGPAREALRLYLGEASREGVMGMVRTARTVRTLAPLADPNAQILEDLREVTAEMERVQARFDRLAERLLKRGRRR